MAASVSTRAVSWNDAFARKLSVLSDARVTPRISGLPTAGSAARRHHPLVDSVESPSIRQLIGKQFRVANALDPVPPEHLPDDRLDVLIVDRNPLVAVDGLHLLHEVALRRLHPFDTEDVMRVFHAARQLLSGGHDVTGTHQALVGDVHQVVPHLDLERIDLDAAFDEPHLT